MTLLITPTLGIDDAHLEERFIRASGPGGQNVNKLSTAVQLRFHAAACAALSDEQRTRLYRLAGARATQDGVIVITAQRFRTQERNREDARARLAALIRDSLSPPRPRGKTRPPLSSKRARTDDKTRRGAIKAMRKAPRGED
ncbi:MAG: alternative ribosome rescue aminoacyl-tRNA hydrolase ArfB [Hyphomonadaceae bacterium]|nr:alternative ribosome rescue aminoacyl-tRNA hydrolase ArfB [Hyphomonadaceae bacterium]